MRGTTTPQARFKTDNLGIWHYYPCPKCRTVKEPHYVCRNLQSIGFFEGFVCGNKGCDFKERAQ